MRDLKVKEAQEILRSSGYTTGGINFASVMMTVHTCNAGNIPLPTENCIDKKKEYSYNTV